MSLTVSELEKLRAVAGTGLLHDALLPALHHLLPGGTLFNNLRLGEHKRTRATLESFAQASREALSDPGRLSRVHAALFDYLHAVEKGVREIDLGRLDHQKLLLTLRLLLPPQRLRRPLVVVIAGPSGSGKDTVLRGVIEALQARGYPAHFLTKYINRRGRPSETSMHPFLRYQLPVEEAEFMHLTAAGEVMFDYEIYGNHYGFSRTGILHLLRPEGAHSIVFIVMSQYALMDRLIDELHAVNPEAEVRPVLVYAETAICLDRLAQRLSDVPYRSHEAFLAARREFDRRAEQVSADVHRIVSDPGLRRFHHVVNGKSDGGRAAMNKLYRLVVGKTAKSRYRIGS